MTLEEKEELINSAKSEEELQERMKQIHEEDEKEKEKENENEENNAEIDSEEERKLLRKTEKTEERSMSDLKLIEKGERNMEERKLYTIASPEYRSAWAKKLMKLDNKLTEEEKRALGDAVTTTATTFVASTADAQGINNGGLFIPTSVREELMELIDEMSPWYRDIRKLQVAGNVDLPFLFEGDDAEWYVELTDTVNEGNEYRNLQLTGWELAKDVVITWKLEEMAVESFITFIIEELAHKMGVALINATLYGDGQNKPTGALNGLTPITTGDDPIANIINTYSSLSEEARRGAKVYVSTSVKIAMIGYKDENGNYPFLQGINGTDLFAIETEPFLRGNDALVGNPRYYILNEVTPTRVEWERTVKGRKTVYGGYGIFDGKAKPGAFAKGVYTPTQSV
jgi:HK97 family phage major capsid protein